MDVIELRGLAWYGYHGAFAEEQRLGQRFVVDLRLGLDLAPAGRSDDLDMTVNYGLVADTVRGIVEGPPFKLIEALAEAIASAVLVGYPSVERVDVKVAKPSAPVPAMTSGLIAVEIARSRVGMTQQQMPDAEAADQIGAAGGGVLTANAVRLLRRHSPPLIDPLLDPESQIQPNGVDITVESVWRIDGTGAIGCSNDARIIPNRVPVDPDVAGWYVLSPGNYMIRFQESVALPLDVMAFGRPRSSLLRCGVAIHTAVWDAGYHGRSEALMVVYAQEGIRLERGARVLQLVFCRLEAPTYAYKGAYQRENLSGDPQDEPEVTLLAGSQC